MTVVQAPLESLDPMESNCPQNPGPEHDHLNLTWKGLPASHFAVSWRPPRLPASRP